jgi:hypothetical protein
MCCQGPAPTFLRRLNKAIFNRFDRANRETIFESSKNILAMGRTGFRPENARVWLESGPTFLFFRETNSTRGITGL